VAHDIVSRAEAGATDPIDVLRMGTRLWLDSCLDPEVRRIVLLDAPSVLGFDEWREIVARHSLGLLAAGLEGAMDAGAIARQSVMALTHVITGALDAAALYVARGGGSAGRPQGDGPGARAARRDVAPVVALGVGSA